MSLKHEVLKTVDLHGCLVQGADLLETVGGLHKFMKWKNALLTVVF
jgi:queuine/archaeosine tRNA-ribosyltransferase